MAEELPEFEDQEAETQVEDEFDRLRQKSARTSSVFDEMEFEDDEETFEEEGFFSQISPGQRLILAVLFLVDIVAIGIGVLLIMGVI